MSGGGCGPYESGAQAARDAHVVYEAIRRPGSPVGAMDTVNRHRLLNACREAGVVVGVYDRQVIAWLAGWEPETVQVVVGLIARARGRGAL